MATLAHYNPNTLKASYNPITSKVIISETCPGCKTTGTFILNFSGIIQCAGAPVPFPSNPNQTYELTYRGHCAINNSEEFFDVIDDWTVTLICLNATALWTLALFYSVGAQYYIVYKDAIVDPCAFRANSIAIGDCGGFLGLQDNCVTPVLPIITGHSGTCKIKYEA